MMLLPKRILYRFLFCCLAAAGMLFLLAGEARAQQPLLADAEAAYQSADYDRAITLFSEVAQNPEAEKERRKKALHYLGRAYVAKDLTEKAREALGLLLKLEPPLVELDPMIEPPPLMDLYYEVRQDLTGSYAVERADPGLQTLAIMDFTNSSVDEHERFEPLRQGFASMMINYMQGATDLKVIERERIQWLLRELQLQREGGIVDQSTAVRTGKLMGAQSVVFGAYTVHEDRIWISARVVKVETGEILLAEQIFGDKDEFFALVQDLSLQTAQAVNVTLEETELGTRVETKSLDAMIAYSDGLALLERGDYRAAYEQFLLAQEYDPGYKRAEMKALSLQPLLATAAGGGADSSPQRMNR